MTTTVLKLLYAKFIGYGVVLELINIMAVVLPFELRKPLTFATNYDVHLQKQVKHHKYTILKNDYDEQYAILTLKRNNMQEMQRMSHELDVQEIDYINAEIKCETEEILREIKSLGKQSTAIIKAENTKTLAQVRAETDATEVLSKARAYAEE